jgi:hypothetical protein
VIVIKRKRTAIYIAVAGALIALVAASWWVNRAVSPWAREKLIAALEERFASTVDLESLDLQLIPRFRAVGTNVVFRHQGRTDVPPLFEIDRFTATSSLPSLLFRRVARLELEGLTVTVARDPEESGDETDDSAEPEGEEDAGGSGFVITTIVANGAHVEILPREAWKQPLTFDLFKLTLRDAGRRSAMQFESVMSNPKPPGQIITSGEFGPWNGPHPRRTPLSGEYTFEDADLSVFSGISGVLSSKGAYEGVLERITVVGTTDVPDFRAGGRPVHLRTRFRAVVDGTSGDTYLEPVDASFLSSKVLATGKVAGLPDRKGKAVALDVVVTDARVEDMVAIAVPLEGEPQLRGPIEFTTTFLLPPGSDPVVRRLQLDGRFGLENSAFATKVQERVNSLSMRAQGKPGERAAEDAAADFDGEFRMNRGTLSFSRVEFTIPGAVVRLSGDYALERGELDLEGHLLMEAKVSETVTGIKSFFLKLADPFFRDGGSTSVPIRIKGPVTDPDLGLAIGGARKAGEPRRKR